MRTQFTQANRPLALQTPLGEDVLLLTGVNGREALGQLFEFELLMQSTDCDIPLDALLGENVTFRLDGGKDGSYTRYFNGIINRFYFDGIKDSIATYRATMVPWLWLLTQTSDCRIFQHKSVPTILKEVLQEAGCTHFEEQLTASYTERAYCVQYRETTFQFISRLMEDAGIYYYFRHENGKHTLILTDSFSTHEPSATYPKINYKKRSAGDSSKECIRSWIYSGNFYNSAYTLRDYDFKRPKSDLTCSAEIPREHAGAGLELYDYPGGYERTSMGDQITRQRLESIQYQHISCRGTSDAQGLVVGELFELADYPRAKLNQAYLVTHMQHTLRGDGFGNAPASEEPLYECQFVCIEKSTQFRSPRTTPRPRIRGMQTALVTGPAGEEIYVDKFGRVKVQFHWDRYGNYDEHSSCWIRVIVPLAGQQWGALFTPRIGEEVLITYIDGDPDRPMVDRSLYNGIARVPYPLPEHKTRSTLKTQSSKGGEGYNEIRLEDKQGAEQIFKHAAKDEDVIVEKDAKEWVKNDAHLHIGHDQFEQVDHDRHRTIKGDQKQQVDGDAHVSVDGDQFETIGETLHLSIKGDGHVQISEDHHLDVGGNHNQSAGKNLSLEGGLNVAIEAGAKLTLKVGGNFIDISAAGVAIKGTLVLINSGGAAGSVVAPASAQAALLPDAPLNPAEVKGGKVAQASQQAPAEPEAMRLDSVEVPGSEVAKSVAEKRFEPQSIEEVMARLQERRMEIAQNGFAGPKYTEEELDYLVQENRDERFIARVVSLDETEFSNSTLGRKRESGRAPYWTTTVDTIEVADTDPMLLAEMLGIDGVSPDNSNLGLVIIDTHKLPPNAARESFVPTHENLANFAKRELAVSGYSEGVIEHALSEEYAPVYDEHAQKIIAANPGNKYAVTDEDVLQEYARRERIELDQKQLLEARTEINSELGANRHFSGNGKTKACRYYRTDISYSQKHTAVENFTFERDPMLIKDLGSAVTYQKLIVI